MRVSERTLFQAIVVLYATFALVDANVGCLDENGQPVDWWIALKLPELSDSTFSPAQAGYAYVYMDKNHPSFKMGSTGLNVNLNGAVGGTLSQIYNADKATTGYLMYNDEDPSGSTHSSYGHTKGDVCFDDKSGFWLVHSVPRWPIYSDQNYGFPDNEKRYGQSFLCMTYATDSFNTIGDAFLLNKPYVYDSNLPASLASRLPNLQAVLDHKFVTQNPANQTHQLTTVAGKSFLDFAKNAEWNSELYENFVAPTLKSNLAVETWMNGSGPLNTSCRATGNNWDVLEIRNLTIDGNFIKETKDHSKWGITISPGKQWTCIGDINRMSHQEQRGGGTVCTSDSTIWDQFRGIITGSDRC